MRPVFRNDLEAAKEEQQGVVFYRIDDPRTQTSFRLYEIEYLIARKLDGSRALDDVISTVKAEYNFDISGPDLKKFVSQLESMGFIDAGGNGADQEISAGVSPEESDLRDATKIVALPKMPLQDPDTVVFVDPDAVQSIDSQDSEQTKEINIEDLAALPGGENLKVVHASLGDRRPTASPEEVERMLYTAFDNLRQGYVVHARDYFVAAKDSAPEDERLVRIGDHLQQLSDSPTESETANLWDVACSLFPDIAQSVGPRVVLMDQKPVNDTPDDDFKTRALYSLLLVAIVIFGVGALVFFMRQAGMFEGSLNVYTQELKTTSVPIYFEGRGHKIEPANFGWLSFGSAGKVARVANVGANINPGDVVASLALKPKAKKKIDRLSKAVAQAAKAQKKATAALSRIQAQRGKLEVNRDSFEKKIKQLRPNGVLKRGGVSKKQLDKLKKQLVRANKKLSKLAKKERKPRLQLAKATHQFNGATRKLQGVQTQIADKLVITQRMGVISERRVKKGAKVKKGTKAVLIRSRDASHVTFLLTDIGDLQTGGEAHISLDTDSIVAGKVVSVNRTGDHIKLVGEFTHSALADAKPSSVRLVHQLVNSSYSIPQGACITDTLGNSFVFITSEGRAIRRQVNILSHADGKLIVHSLSNELRNGDLLITKAAGDGDLKKLADDSAVEVLTE